MQVEMVGSCCTLVAEKFFQDMTCALPKELAWLMYGKSNRPSGLSSVSNLAASIVRTGNVGMGKCRVVIEKNLVDFYHVCVFKR